MMTSMTALTARQQGRTPFLSGCRTQFIVLSLIFLCMGSRPVLAQGSAPNKPHKDYVRQLAISASGQWVASWGKDALRIWDIARQTARCDAGLPVLATTDMGRISKKDMNSELSTDVLSMHFSADESLLRASTRNGQIWEFKTDDCALIRRRTVGDAPVHISTGRTDRWVSAHERTVRVYDPSGERDIHLDQDIRLISLSPSGEHLLLLLHRDDAFQLDRVHLGAVDTRTTLIHPTKPIWFRGDSVRYFGWSDDGQTVFMHRYAQSESPEAHIDTWHVKDWSRSTIAIRRSITEGSTQKAVAFEGSMDWNVSLTLLNGGSELLFLHPWEVHNSKRIHWPSRGRIDLVSGEVSRERMELGVIRTNLARLVVWATVESTVGPRAAYGDQNGNVAVFDLRTGATLFKMDKTIHGRPSVKRCDALLEHLIQMANHSLKTTEAVMFQTRRSFLKALNIPNAQKIFRSECVTRAVETDVDCYLGLNRWDDLYTKGCRLGAHVFP